MLGLFYLCWLSLNPTNPRNGAHFVVDPIPVPQSQQMGPQTDRSQYPNMLHGAGKKWPSFVGEYSRHGGYGNSKNQGFCGIYHIAIDFYCEGEKCILMCPHLCETWLFDVQNCKQTCVLLGFSWKPIELQSLKRKRTPCKKWCPVLSYLSWLVTRLFVRSCLFPYPNMCGVLGWDKANKNTPKTM